MRRDWQLIVSEKLAEAAAGFVCGMVGFVLHMFALAVRDAGAALTGGEPVSWGRVFWMYALGGAVLGMVLGERFFKYLEERWFGRR